MCREFTICYVRGFFPFSSEDPYLSFVFGIANAEIESFSTRKKEINEEMELIQNELISDVEFQKIRNMIENDFIYNFFIYGWHSRKFS